MNTSHVTQDGLVTVKEHLEKQISHLENIIRLEINNTEKALVLAKKELEKRMEGFPEVFIKKEDIRKELDELKAKLEDTFDRINAEITSLHKSKSEMEGKASQQSLMMVMAIAITSFVLGAMGLIMRALKF